MARTVKHERLGQSTTAKCGQVMTIIKYTKSADIDVKFEDGTIVKHKAYKQFIIGEIANPNIPIHSYSDKTRNIMKDRVGETVTMKCGLSATIVAYNSANDIDILFENGMYVRHKKYLHFKNGSVRIPMVFGDIKIVEFAYIHNGQWFYECESKNWENNKILSVQELSAFMKSTSSTLSRKNEKVSRVPLVGQETTTRTGYHIVCIADRGSKDIDVQFDDGMIAKHQRRESFFSGYIRHPNDKTSAGRHADKHVGETYTDIKGRKMTIIDYINNDSVTIQYDDGVILYGKDYRVIKRGGDMRRHDYVGETNIARNGLSMEIIEARRHDDLTIKFEDGVIVKHKNYQAFKNGAVKHPNINARKVMTNRLGETRIMKCGLKAEIIKYDSCMSVDVKFENGMIVKSRTYNAFHIDSISLPKQIGNIRIHDFAYIYQDDWYYICSHSEWLEPRIMSVHEIYEYDCLQDTGGEMF